MPLKSRKRICSYGIKKSGSCKKKPGPKISTSKRTSRKKYIRSVQTSKRICKIALGDKIGKNTIEYYNGKYVNRKQAIAVAYAQIKKRYPECKLIL